MSFLSYFRRFFVRVLFLLFCCVLGSDLLVEIMDSCFVHLFA
jgi:hypothetical protein